jgi:hypothetical protein
MERTIGNLGQEIRQPSNPYMNLSREGVRRCQVNTLKAMVPGLVEPTQDLPQGSVDLGDGYSLLRKRDPYDIQPQGGAARAIREYLGADVKFVDGLVCAYQMGRLPEQCGEKPRNLLRRFVFHAMSRYVLSLSTYKLFKTDEIL